MSTASSSLAYADEEAIKGRTMYIESNASRLAGSARKTGRMPNYSGLTLPSFKSPEFDFSYNDIDTGEEYRASRPRTDGGDDFHWKAKP